MTEQGAGSGASAAPTHVDDPYHAPHNRWLIAAVATLATFMEVLDTTIVVVALPHIAGDLGASEADATWIVAAYILAIAVTLPLSSWVSSLMGRKNYYLASVAMFTVTSLLCGLADSLVMLTLFRLLQGVAGAGLQPSTQAILVDTFPARQRGMSMALFGVVVVIAPVIGPILGGWIADNYSWRWIFFINIPVGILSLTLASKFISDPPFFVRRRGPDRFKVDYMGVIFLVVGLGGVELVLIAGERRDWYESWFIIWTTVIAALALVSAVFWELRHKDPLLNLRLLRDRNLGASVLLFLLFGFGFYGSMILLPLYLQGPLGYSAVHSGLAVAPGGMVMIVMMPFVGWLVGRVDPRKMVAFGFMVLSYSLFLMSHFHAETDFLTVLVARMIQSFGVSFIFVPINTMAYAYVAPGDRSESASLMSLSRNAGSSIGITVAAALLTRNAQVHHSTLVENYSPNDPAYVHMLASATEIFSRYSSDAGAVLLRAQALLYGMLQEQAAVLAFESVYRILAVSVLIVMPVLFFMRR